MESKRQKFLKIYANVPDKIREEDIIAVVENRPFTWSNAAIEIKNRTDKGNKILMILEKMGII